MHPRSESFERGLGKFFSKICPKKKSWNNTYMTRVRFRYWKD